MIPGLKSETWSTPISDVGHLQGSRQIISVFDPNIHDPFHRPYNPSDEFSELTARWKNRVTGKRQSLTDLYVEGRLTLLGDLDISIPRKTLLSNGIRNNEPITDVSLTTIVQLNADTVNKSKMSSGQDDSVFVFDVEVMKMD